MTERPILMNGAMVRATLDGSKTQTRRIANTGLYAIDTRFHNAETVERELSALTKNCPYGQPGDRLWVREAFAKTHVCQAMAEWFVYRECDNRTDYGGPWKPSIHMPHRASRILLEITSVRLERLNDCSEGDARAEGAKHYEPANHLSHGGWSHDEWQVHETAKASFEKLWERINGARSWNANPWVWVVEFKRVTP